MNVDEFLGFYFPGVNPRSDKEAVAIGGDRKSNTSWAARRWQAGKEPLPVGRLYFCISTVRVSGPRDQYLTKGAVDLIATYVIGLDDIGTKFPVPALPPTTVIETSLGNFQYFYRLRYPADPDKAAALIRGLAIAKMTDAGAGRADRYLRVPGSINTKRSPPFVARVVEHHPDRAWSLSELEVAFGVPADAPRKAASAPPALPAGQVDPLFEWLLMNGDVEAEPDARGWHRMTCPWEDGHSPGPGATKGTDYHPGAPGGFSCLHEHCIDRRTSDLRAWVLEQDPAARLGPEAAIDMAAAGSAIRRAIGRQDESEPNEQDGSNSAPDDDSEKVRFTPPPDEVVRAAIVAGYIHVEVEDRYWSVESGGLAKRSAVVDRITARMKQTSLLHVHDRNGKRLKDMPVDVWLRNQEDIRRVGGLTHRLGQPLIIENCVNIAPPIPEPVDYTADPTPWLELVDRVLQTGPAAEHWLDWSALLVSAWDEKPGWVPMLKGIPGAGKGMMLNPIKRYLGDRHWLMIQPQELAGQFTYYASRRLVILEELKQNTRGQLTQHDIYTIMKKWTGRGNRMVTVRDLNKMPYSVLDLSGWVMFSNEFAPLPLEKRERRVAVFSTAPPHTDSWYLPIGKWIDNGGWQTVIGFLQQRWRDMSEAERETVRGNAPMTEAKQELIDVSGGGPIGGAIRLCVSGRHGEPWPDLMTMGDITNALSTSGLLSNAEVHRSLGEMTLSAALRDEGAERLFGGKQVEYPAGRKLRLWCVRGEKTKEYEKQGQGKMLAETYDAMKTRGMPASVANIIKMKPK